MKLPRQELTGRFVRLEPLESKHREGLRQACAADQVIWEIYPWSMLDEHYDKWWSRTVTPTSEWNLFATIFDDAVVGVTGFVPEHAPGVVHVGSTYFRPEVRGGPTNTEAKLLLLTHAFDGGARRVAFNVDPLNARSRAAMRKLGAIEEGITREASVTWTGRVRDLVVFSILSREWSAVRANLSARLSTF